MGVTEILKSRNPIVELEKLHLRIFPAKTFAVPNDKFTKQIFNLNDQQYQNALAGEQRGIIEKRNHKKKGIIGTPYKLYNNANCHNTEPLTIFDLAVLSACTSEWAAGNRYTTVAIIYRAITGKVGKGRDHKPSPVMRDNIMKSLLKLMGTIVTPDMTDLCEYLKYNNGTPIKFRSTILPASIIEASVGGNDVTTIFFDRESPCWTIANIKNQILRYDASLLDIPNQNNTPMNVALKTYAIRRVMEIKAHKMTPTLTFDDIFKKCRITNASRKTKMDARNALEKFFEQLKSNGEVNSFNLVKKNAKFYSITISYSPAKAKPPEPPKETTPPPENPDQTKNPESEKSAPSETETTTENHEENPAPVQNLFTLRGGTEIAPNVGRRFGNVG